MNLRKRKKQGQIRENDEIRELPDEDQPNRPPTLNQRLGTNRFDPRNLEKPYDDHLWIYPSQAFINLIQKFNRLLSSQSV